MVNFLNRGDTSNASKYHSVLTRRNLGRVESDRINPLVYMLESGMAQIGEAMHVREMTLYLAQTWGLLRINGPDHTTESRKYENLQVRLVFGES